ncbi:MAG: glycosyltransferase family 2 protein, partial [Myxococcota bacterium]|nr:glycosyltransferase family 2 protein [Myxococcota bacterium]
MESFVEENTLLKDDLAQCRFEHVLAQKSDDIHESEAANLGIAAQHLEQWAEARTFFKQWAKHGAHTSTGDLVSIIIPTHNRPELLKRALQSAIHQLYENLEIIVVNDAGQDVSHVVDALQTERTITLINHSKNQYLAAARNTGLNAANGKYICYLDDDDQLYLHHIGHLVQILSCTNAKAAQAMPYYLTPDKESMTGYFLKGCPFRPFTLQEVLVLNIVPVNCILH